MGIGRAAEAAQKHSSLTSNSNQQAMHGGGGAGFLDQTQHSSHGGCATPSPQVPQLDSALMSSHDLLSCVEEGMTSLENRLRRLMSPSPGNSMAPDSGASVVETTIVQEIGFVNNRIGLIGNRIGILLDQLHV